MAAAAFLAELAADLRSAASSKEERNESQAANRRLMLLAALGPRNPNPSRPLDIQTLAQVLPTSSRGLCGDDNAKSLVAVLEPGIVINVSKSCRTCSTSNV